MDPHHHFQLRLVKRIDGRRIVTHGPMANANGIAAKDKTLDFSTKGEAVKSAKDYCCRGSRRKGPLPGEFLGVVVVRRESDQTRWISVGSLTAGMKVSKRPKRVKGTTTWLSYVDKDGVEYHVDPVTHRILERA